MKFHLIGLKKKLKTFKVGRNIKYKKQHPKHQNKYAKFQNYKPQLKKTLRTQKDFLLVSN